LIGIALCTATLAQAANRGNEPRTPTTVGNFLVQVATAIDGQPQTLDAARETLRRLGANGAFDASATLTEGVVTRLIIDLGVQASPAPNPGAPVSAVRSAAVASHLGAVLEGKGLAIDDLPTACLNSDNRGACVNCCKDAGAAANLCAHFCVANVPAPPSDEEPNP
jgi:hypothetical protein